MNRFQIPGLTSIALVPMERMQHHNDGDIGTPSEIGNYITSHKSIRCVCLKSSQVLSNISAYVVRVMRVARPT